MSSHRLDLRRIVAAVLLVFVLGSVSACAEIHPDNTPHSPKFRNYDS